MRRLEQERWSRADVSRLLALAEADRRANERTLAALPSALVVLRADWTIVALNRQFSLRFGGSADDLLGANLLALAPFQPLRQRLLDSVPAAGAATVFQAETGPTGSSELLRFAFSPLDDDADEASAEQFLLCIDPLQRPAPAEPHPAGKPARRAERAVAPPPATAAPPAAEPTADTPTVWAAEQRLEAMLREFEQGFHPPSTGTTPAEPAPAPAFAPKTAGADSLSARLEESLQVNRELAARLEEAENQLIAFVEGDRSVRALELEIEQLRAALAATQTESAQREEALAQAQTAALDAAEDEPGMAPLGRFTASLHAGFHESFETIAERTAALLAARESRSVPQSWTETLAEIQAAAAHGLRLARQWPGSHGSPSARLETVDLNQLLIEWAGGSEWTSAGALALSLDADRDPLCLSASALLQTLRAALRYVEDLTPQAEQLTVHTALSEVDAAPAESLPRLRPGLYVEIRIGPRAALEAASGDEPATALPPSTHFGASDISSLERFCEQSGGCLAAVATPAGPFVRLHLPASSTPAVEPLAPAQPPESLHLPASILLIEPDESLRGLLRLVLQRRGHRVFDTRSTDEAAELCGDPGRSFDLLLADIGCESTADTALLQRLAQLRPGMKTIYVSNRKDSEALTLSASGSQSILLKPFTIDGLLLRVDEVLGASGAAAGS